MEIRCNFRTSAGREAPANQFTSKIYNYFYTNRNEVIQKPKLILRKSIFHEKYHKNTISSVSNPEKLELKYVLHAPTSTILLSFLIHWSCFQFSFNPYQINIHEHEFMQENWYLRFHKLTNSITKQNNENNEKNWWTNLSYQEDLRKLEVFWVEMEGGFWLKKKKESRLSDEKSEENGRDF